MKSILDYETVELVDDQDLIRIIDQTKLPGTIELKDLRSAQDIWTAINLLQVRGAPAIGVTAAFAVYLLTKHVISVEDDIPSKRTANFAALKDAFKKEKKYLITSRPTAVNLSWALNRMEAMLLSMEHTDLSISEIVQVLHGEAVAIRDEDVEVCKKIGEYGLTLVKPGDGLLTHCNAGQLATVKYGTATAPIYLGHKRGYGFHVYCDETRPLLQGARLTAFELQSAGVDVTLICDNMSASVMRQGNVQAVFVGCDRVAANGDTANKIGTSVVAAVAARYHVPFYVCAPTSTIDMTIPGGDHIPIEQRKPEEVTEMWYRERMAPESVKVYNPAFDITDNDLITGIVTEYGIARAPYTESLRDIFHRKEAAVRKEAAD